MPSVHALSYMKDFKCLGGDCPATCCKGWGITLDQGQYKKFKQATKNTPSLRDTFTVLKPKKQTKNLFAIADQLPTGHCVALQDDGLCEIHATLGPDFLPKICDTFPRRRFRAEEDVYLYGEVSCPPIAKEILENDDSLLFIELEEENDNSPVHQVLSSKGCSPYDSAFGVFRDVGVHLLTQMQYPLNTRLYFLLQFAHKTSLLLNIHSKDLDAEALDEAANEVTDVAYLEAQATEFRKHVPHLPGLLNMVAVLANKAQPTRQPEFVALINEVFSGLYLEMGGAGGTGLNPENIQRILAITVQRSLNMQMFGEGALDNYQSRLAVHYWLSRPYRKQFSLFEHTSQLLASIGIQKFCVLNHPAMIPLIAQRSADALSPTLGEVMVDSSVALGRYFEHGETLSQCLLQVQGLQKITPMQLSLSLISI